MNRWWTYQRERFPLLAHGPLILAFSCSAVCLSALLRTQPGAIPSWPHPATILVAFLGALLFFLQLRIADEFKDFAEDSRYRPYRPVPRGLVTLRELGLLFILCALVQFLLTAWERPGLLTWLALVWAYLALMSREFYVGEWLRTRPLTYMASHMLIMPCIDLYVTACDWLAVQSSPPPGLIWFLLLSYANGMVLEVGRKLRAPHDEEEGVPTYSALWGPRRATLAWLGLLLLTATLAVITAALVEFAFPVLALLLALLIVASALAWRFLRRLTPGSGRPLEQLSAVWTLVLYLTQGLVPLLWRRLTLGGLT